MLSPQELEAYRDEGYVVPSFRLTHDEISPFRNALDAVIRANPEVRPELLVNAHVQHDNAEGVRGHEAFLELARDPRILDLVESVIGPNIILWGLQIFCKPPADGMEVPFHQDGEYWPIRPLATCTVWIAIDDSVIANGCLQVIPGSHTNRQVFQHSRDNRSDLVLTQTVTDAGCDLTRAVDVELEAGQMSLHDVYLVHGSNPNQSTRRRAGVAIRYMPASSHFSRDQINPGDAAGFHVDFSQRPLWLMRGQDACGKNDFKVGHPT